MLNVCGVIITTNHKTDGIYLPADDRRHLRGVVRRVTKEDFDPNYWNRALGRGTSNGGDGHVAAYLAELRPRPTSTRRRRHRRRPAFWDIVDANRAPEDAELADALDALGRPEATTIAELAERASNEFREWLLERRHSRLIPHRMEAAGYGPVRNDSTSDGRWKVAGKNRVIYAKQSLSPRDRIAVARQLTEASR